MYHFIIPLMNGMVSEIISNILPGRKHLTWVLVLLPPNSISGFKLHQNYTSIVFIYLSCCHCSKNNFFVSTSKMNFGYFTKFWYASNLEKGSLNLQKLIILIYHRDLSPEVNNNYKLYKTETKNQ